MENRPSYVGLEILLVMGEDKAAEEIVGLLNKEGFLVTRLSNYSQAVHLLENKFFVVALFDLDTPEQNEGLRLLKKCRTVSPVTHPIMLARHKCSANHVIKANNLGCYEFVILNDVVGDYLIIKVKEYAALVSYKGERDRLLKKVADVHNKFFKRMFALHIKAMDAEEDLIAISGIPDEELPPIQILVVDDKSALLNTLTSTLTPALGWNFRHLTLASEALDQSASGDFHVALINKNL
ncbi:response regulator, partial [Myxococcota bacterium]|nr:response regulator [Myxococcota bacterium]